MVQHSIAGAASRSVWYAAKAGSHRVTEPLLRWRLALFRGWRCADVELRPADTGTNGDLALPAVRRGLVADRGGCRVGVRAVAQVTRQRMGTPSRCSVVDVRR